MELTNQQQFVANLALQGHNMFITGKAGTGKSFLVKSMFKSLTNLGKKCKIVCPTGIACEAYSEENASTIHSFFGLGVANRPFDVLVNSSTSNNLVKSRVESVNVLFWDEVSMSSRVVLELVNNILMEIRQDERPFGGIQVIAVGEFKQLRPVPSKFDSGEFMFLSEVFKQAFVHKYELEVPMRQNVGEERFIESLKCLQDGNITPLLCEFMLGLDRPLTEGNCDDPVHIYFRNDSVSLHNINRLREMHGECTVYDAKDKDNCGGLKCPAEKCVPLKIGAKVMLVWNLNEKLHNGSMGTVRKLHKEYCEVHFPGYGNVSLKKQTWSNFNENGQVIGSRTQIPLKLCWAISAHKSQGLTLPSVVLHCSREFSPGLIYVACSRVKAQKQLQVKNFKKSFIQRPPKIVTEFHSSINNKDIYVKPDCSCCRRPLLDVPYIGNAPIQNEDGETDDEDDTDFVEDDNVVNDLFHSPAESPVNLDLLDVFLLLHDEQGHSILYSPPDDFEYTTMVASLKKDFPIETPFLIEHNTLLDFLILDENVSRTKLFIDIQWHKIRNLLPLPDDIEDLSDASISRQKFTKVGEHLHSLIVSNELKNEVLALFKREHEQLSEAMISIGSQLVQAIYSTILNIIAEMVRSKEENEEVTFNLEEMPDEGKAKVRYVGAWMIRKALEKSRRYVRENKFSLTNDEVMARVRREHNKMNLLNDYVIIPFESLENETSYPLTLGVTEDRQYRGRGLLHICDEMYEFTMQLEEIRIQLLNEHKFHREKENIVSLYEIQLLDNTQLRLKWSSVIPAEPDLLVSKLIYDSTYMYI